MDDQLTDIRTIYPKKAAYADAHPQSYENYGPQISDYIPLIDSMGDVLAQWDENDYQGDSVVVLSRQGQFGVLVFGWGSCSGCDALQACGTWEEVNDLRRELFDSIRWGTATDAADYLTGHDWEGDSIHPPAEWISDAVRVLNGELSPPVVFYGDERREKRESRYLEYDDDGEDE